MFCTSIFSQDRENFIEQVDKIYRFDTNIDFLESDGMMISAIIQDSVFTFPMGNFEQSKNSQFQVGSISKIFTSKLIDIIGINKEKSVCDFLSLDQKYCDIKVRDLLDHTSGLPKQPYFYGRIAEEANNPYSNYPDELIVPQLNEYVHMYESNQDEFIYGHLNYALLGLILEKESGSSYCELLDQYFGLASLQCSDQADSLNLGISKSGKFVAPWDFPGFVGSEGLAINVTDLSSFVQSEIKEENTSEANKEHKVQKNLVYQNPYYYVKKKRQARTYAFSGTTGTHAAFLCFDKKNKSGVVILRNSAEGIQDFALLILQMINDHIKKQKNKSQ